MDATGHQILATDKLPALHAAVMKACANSAGLIVDPRTCTFDPRSIACPSGVDTVSCLTPAQVAMVRMEYRGPTDPAGRNLFDGGEPYGSELAWAGWLVGSPTDLTCHPRDAQEAAPWSALLPPGRRARTAPADGFASA